MLNNRFASDVDIEDETVSLLCDMVFEPLIVDGAFDKAYTEGEKTNLIDTIQAEINEKGKYAVIEPLEHSQMSETAEKIYVSLDFSSEVKKPDLYEGLYVSVFYEGKVSASGSKTITMEGTSAIYLYADMNYMFNPAIKINKQEHTTIAFIA